MHIKLSSKTLTKHLTQFTTLLISVSIIANIDKAWAQTDIEKDIFPSSGTDQVCVFTNAWKYQDSTCKTPYLSLNAHENVREKVDQWSSLIRLSVNNCVGYPPACQTGGTCTYYVKAKCDNTGLYINKYSDDTCDEGSRVNTDAEKKAAKEKGQYYFDENRVSYEWGQCMKYNELEYWMVSAARQQILALGTLLATLLIYVANV